MGKIVLICTLLFVVGALATAAPFLISGHFAHLDEAARREETMGPGITTFFGLLVSPLGGIVAVLIGLSFLRRAKQAQGVSGAAPRANGPDPLRPL